MRELISDIYAAMMENEPLVLATIVEHRGSTPRSAGASMMVRPNGSIVGTIGGGWVEGVVIEEALALFQSKGAVFNRYDLTEAGNLDLVCGGEMEVMLEHFAPSSENFEMVELLFEELKGGSTCHWLGKITETENSWMVERAVNIADRTWLGSATVASRLQNRLNEFLPRCGDTTFFECDGERYLMSVISPSDTVCIMGAGHVSREIARLTKQVDFRTLVFDDRAEFANVDHFPGADGVFVCNDFATVFKAFGIPAGSYILIVTRGHHHDKDVLNQALRSEAAYIGMIGSHRKRERIYQALMQEGVQQQALLEVHCPIGLAIDAETPAEIAVSVVAELIQHRARRKQYG